MNRLISIAAVLAFSNVALSVDSDKFGSAAHQFQIEFVTIGDPGNAPNLDPPPKPAAEGPEGLVWMQAVEPGGNRGLLNTKQVRALRGNRTNRGRRVSLSYG